MIVRRKTNTVSLKNIKIGHEHPITIQSMCNTKTTDIKSTVAQINELISAGCDIIRVAVPDMESAESLKIISKEIHIPIIADVHFDYKLAIQAIKNGANGIRINPGNIGKHENIKKIVEVANDFQTAIRIGVNSGSIAKHIIDKFGVTPEGIAESALENVSLLENLNFNNIKISAKASSVSSTIEAYNIIAKKTNYPLHIGVTEAGTIFNGTIKSAISIGNLLYNGIGDTIRVSLTDNPIQEIKVAKAILKSLNIRKGLNIISCPTCGRTNIPLIELTNQVENRLKQFEDCDITVAVMGCEVNGPGEAKEADFGIAGGKNEGIIFAKGKIIKKVSTENLIEELFKIIFQSGNVH